MLFSKPSKKTKKNADENTSGMESNAAEITKPRVSKSSKSKNSDPSETGSAKHRKPASKPTALHTDNAPAIGSPRDADVRTFAAAAGANTSQIQSAASGAVSQEVPAPTTPVVSREAIAERAYSYWVARGYAPGSPEQDWLRAEQELAAKR
jgi:hypothetical protein